MKKSKLVTIVGGSVVALASALGGTYYATRPSSPQFSEAYNKEDYTLDDFKKVLGDRVIPEREEELEEFWRKDNEEGARSFKMIHEMYSDYRIYYNKLSNSEKKEFDKFNLNDLEESELKEIQKIIPWKLFPENKKISESDKAFLYDIHGLRHFSIGRIFF